MGFHTGQYAKVWEVKPTKSDTCVSLRISTSYKNKNSGQYEQDFSGFVFACGTATAAKAAKLQSGDKIRLGNVDVTTKYDKENKITYTNYKMFSFETEEEALANGNGGGGFVQQQAQTASKGKKASAGKAAKGKAQDSPPLDEIIDNTEDDLPW